MKSSNAKALLDQIDIAINDIIGFSAASSLEKSYLAKFLIVFICGIYEEAIETIVNEMAQKKSTSEIAAYISNTMNAYFRNPDINNICTCLNRFNPEWRKQIKNLPQQQKQALDSIVSNKNAIAHGQQVTILLSDVTQYYIDSKNIILEIDKILL